VINATHYARNVVDHRQIVANVLIQLEMDTLVLFLTVYVAVATILMKRMRIAAHVSNYARNVLVLQQAALCAIQELNM
jgi:hypothetical protein